MPHFDSPNIMNTSKPKPNAHSHLLSDPAIPSSSPAFATPQHAPLPPRSRPPIPQPAFKPATVLPITLPAATLRPLAVRLFSRKHDLTLSTTALITLAAFVGRQCGSGWKTEGLAEGVLEEVARLWKRQGGGSIVNDDGETLKSILKTVESCMSGGKVISGKKGLSRQTSFAFGDAEAGARPGLQPMESFGMSSLELKEGEEEEEGLKDPREWLKVIDAYEQPRLVYNITKKHFDR
jgi:DNA polymerase epsilon subunit 2